MPEESSKPSAEIIDISDTPELFLELLPNDWKLELESNWKEFAPAVKVYGIKLNQELIGGGLVFSDQTSETDNYPPVAEYYFDNGFLYIGYLWVAEIFRGQNLGDFWLNSIFEMYPKNPFWLSIEDAGLAKFYLKNGFTLEREVMYSGGKDWIYVRKSASDLV
ncbi:GNAT family N-acetyltransferase [Roseivirga sp.]|uniref:GNAT family N-acetyltransferase n=1 Tax=Roseivirga sp. TaxID=1964215 RepID=UPI002B268056|nr:GNAT family N-acetyltransferase [Roseivirga sp.]